MVPTPPPSSPSHNSFERSNGRTGATGDAGNRVGEDEGRCRAFNQGHRPCPGATATRYRAAGVAGSLGAGEIADMAAVGTGRRYREEGCPQGPKLFVEPWRVWATEILVSRCGRCR